MTKDEAREYECVFHNATVLNPKYFSATVSKNVARKLLEHSIIINNGEGYRFKAKSLGLGVYEMKLVTK